MPTDIGQLPTHHGQLTTDPLAAITSQTFVRAVDWLDDVDSTNSQALRRAVEPNLVLPRLIWAGRQAAGRGRGGNAWWSEPGALTCSLLVDGPAIGLPPPRWPQVSMITSIAVAETLEQFLPAERIGLKWPNDVQLDRRKVAGILVEAAAAVPGRLVVGLGLNVGNSLRRAPEELQRLAVSLADVLPSPPALVDVLLEFLLAWQTLTQQLRDGTLDLAERWSRQCVLSHEAVILTQGEQRIAGVCRGITPDGALLLDVQGCLQPHWAGTVRLAEK
jgi:BirA family biotin operon repressor/biotin-[acetyl-CoA-carboxylase] ligase